MSHRNHLPHMDYTLSLACTKGSSVLMKMDFLSRKKKSEIISGAYLFVGTVIVSLFLIHSLRCGLLVQELVQGDTGIVCSENLHTQSIHELPKNIVQILGTECVKQLTVPCLLCRANCFYIIASAKLLYRYVA